jgi:hypothetical protein
MDVFWAGTGSRLGLAYPLRINAKPRSPKFVENGLLRLTGALTRDIVQPMDRCQIIAAIMAMRTNTGTCMRHSGEAAA